MLEAVVELFFAHCFRGRIRKSDLLFALGLLFYLAGEAKVAADSTLTG